MSGRNEISRVVLITGCSSGIGKATALRLAKGGWTVYATARKTSMLQDLEAAGCRTLALDVTDEQSMKAAVETIERALRTARPAARYVVTPSARLFMWMRSLLSDRLWDAFMRSIFPQPSSRTPAG